MFKHDRAKNSSSNLDARSRSRSQTTHHAGAADDASTDASSDEVATGLSPWLVTSINGDTGHVTRHAPTTSTTSSAFPLTTEL